jgi:Tol biopolymer transport system component
MGDSKKIVYASYEDPSDDESKQTLFEVSPDGTISTVKPKTDGDYYAWISGPRSSADGVHIVHISDRAKPYHYDVLITNLQTGESKSVGAAKVSRYNQNPVMTADGARILFLAGTQWNGGSRPIFSLWQVNADGTDAQQLADSSLFTSPEKWNESR